MGAPPPVQLLARANSVSELDEAIQRANQAGVKSAAIQAAKARLGALQREEKMEVDGIVYVVAWQHLSSTCRNGNSIALPRDAQDGTASRHGTSHGTSHSISTLFIAVLHKMLTNLATYTVPTHPYAPPPHRQ